MIPTIRKWLTAALPLLKVLSTTTTWSNADDAAVAWLERFNNDPDSAMAEVTTEAGKEIRLGLVRLLSWLENHIHKNKISDEVIAWLHHLIVG